MANGEIFETLVGADKRWDVAAIPKSRSFYLNDDAR
jgi:hypothetical protein